MDGDASAPFQFSSQRMQLNNHRSPIRTKTASEQSSPKNENSPRKLRELMKRNAGFMAKASRSEGRLSHNLTPMS
jgi:hypothetical protein